MSGRMMALDTPRFSSSPTVMIETGVTSEPVPAVVGASTRGRRGPFACATPQAPSMSSPEPRRSAATFATSSDEPPPKPATPVAPAERPASTAFITVASEGSASTESKIATDAPTLSSDAMAASHRPSLRRPGSVTNSTVGPSRLPAIAPKRLAEPASKTIEGVVLKVKACIGRIPLESDGRNDWLFDQITRVQTDAAAVYAAAVAAARGVGACWPSGPQAEFSPADRTAGTGG